MTEQQNEIVAYWLEKANESLESAQLEFSQGHLSFCVNRLYYAAFYAVSAMLTQRSLKYGKHSAVRSSFHRDFVRKGIVSPEMGKLYDRLFLDRQEADYTAFVNLDIEVVKNEIDQVQAFINLFHNLLEKEKIIT